MEEGLTNPPFASPIDPRSPSNHGPFGTPESEPEPSEKMPVPSESPGEYHSPEQHEMEARSAFDTSMETSVGDSAQELGFSMLYDHGTVNNKAGASTASKSKLRKGPGAALSKVLRRRPSTIVPDDAVSKCMNCGDTFHLGLRRHHCRW